MKNKNKMFLKIYKESHSTISEVHLFYYLIKRDELFLWAVVLTKPLESLFWIVNFGVGRKIRGTVTKGTKY